MGLSRILEHRPTREARPNLEEVEITDHTLVPTSLGDEVQLGEPLPTPQLSAGALLHSAGAIDSSYHPGVLDPQTQRRFLARLLPGGEVPYQQWYHMPDQRRPRRALRPLRRIKVAMATDPGDDTVPHYRFPVNDQQRYGVVCPMTPTVEQLRCIAEAKTGHALNHAVVLVYRDGDDGIGFHKDKVLDLDPGAPIVSFSLGAERPLRLRDQIHQPSVEIELRLAPGGMFVLGPQTNAALYHAIPRLEDPRLVGPRVSVTFRRTLTFRGADDRLTGRGEAHQGLNWPAALHGRHRLDDALDQPLPAERS